MAVLITKCGARTCGAGAPGPGRRARAGSCAIALALGASLCSCSVAQKADVFDWFGSDKPAADQSQPLNTDEPYPNLADVPGRPARPPAIDRDKIAQGLVADRANAQYTEDVLRRTPEVPPRQTPAARPAASPPPVAPPPPPPAPPAPPVQTSSLPPAPAAPPVQTQAAPPAPVVEAPPPSAYARPADVPVDRNAPPVQVINNQPVVSPGFYGTQAPPSPPTPAAPSPVAPSPVAPSAVAPPPTTSLDPLQRAVAVPPPVPSAPAAAVKPSPVAVARSENVAVRPTEPPAEPPPPAPRDVAPIPPAPIPQASIPPAPSALPTSPRPATPPMVAALPPPPVGTPPDRLDEALRQTFPDAGRRMGIDALAATIYFAEGSANLTDDDRSILREVGRLYRERGGGVRVVGYASSDGRSADLVTRRLANLDIAVRRADAVSRELARSGVPAGTITTSAEGAPTGLGTAGGGFGPAGERRVDIYLDY